MSRGIPLRGDRDLSFEELTRRARKLFTAAQLNLEAGTGANGKPLFTLAVFLDGLPYRPLDSAGHPIFPHKRPQKLIASGESWSEVLRKAELATGKMSS